MWAFLYLLVTLELSARLGRRVAPCGNIWTQWGQGLAVCFLAYGLCAGLLSWPGWLSVSCVRLMLAPALPLLCLRPRAPQALRQAMEGENAMLTRAFLVGWSVVLLASLAPTTHWDTQTYHYLLPRLYVAHGGWYSTHIGQFDSMVSLIHFVWSWSFAFGGETSANLTGPLFLWMFYCCLAGLEPLARHWSAALTFSSPLLLFQAEGGLPDLAGLAYVGAFLTAPIAALSALWALVAVLVRVTSGPAILICLFFRPQRSGRGLLALGAIVSLVFLMLGLRLPWDLKYLRGDWSAGGYELLFPAPWQLHQSRGWAHSLSPLLVAGLLIGTRSRKWIPLSCAGLLAAGLAQLAEARYVLSWLIGIYPAAAIGWSEATPRLRRIGQACVCVAATLSLAPLAARIPPAVGLTSRASFLERRVTPVLAYNWLRGTTYRRVLLTDPRGYLCPIPFQVMAAVPQWDTPERLRRRLVALDCDLVLWNFNSPDVADRVLEQAAHTPSRDFEHDLLRYLGTEWLKAHLSSRGASGDIAPNRLGILYEMTRDQVPVFCEAGLVAVPFPHTSRSAREELNPAERTRGAAWFGAPEQ